MQRCQLVFLGGVILLASSVCAPGADDARVGSTGLRPKTPARAVRFQSVRSAEGRFTVRIPVGWELKRFAPDESSIGVSPMGERYPEVSIAFTEASALAAQKAQQALGHQWYGQQLSAREFLEAVFLPLLRHEVADLKVEVLRSGTSATADATVSGSAEGKTVQAKITCVVEHLHDPTLPPAGGWYNFAYLNFLVAPPELMPTAEPVAAQIFHSFRPTERWLAETMQAIAQGMATRGAIIRGTVQRLNAMEMQQRMAEMRSTTKIGKGWMDALGGTAEVKNTETGETWRVSDDSKYYYEEAGRVYGTDDPTDLNLPGRQRLEK